MSWLSEPNVASRSFAARRAREVLKAEEERQALIAARAEQAETKPLAPRRHSPGTPSARRAEAVLQKQALHVPDDDEKQVKQADMSDNQTPAQPKPRGRGRPRKPKDSAAVA